MFDRHDSSLSCGCREHSNVRQLMEEPDLPLHEFSHSIILVEDPIVNNISSTVLRQQLAQVLASSPPQLGKAKGPVLPSRIVICKYLMPHSTRLILAYCCSSYRAVGSHSSLICRVALSAILSQIALLSTSRDISSTADL